MKKQGGNITIDDFLNELEKQGVDFEKEDENTIIIDGKYIYELEKDLLTNLPVLSESGARNITFHYSVEGEVINETEWTKGPVLMTARLNSELEEYTLQYTTSDSLLESDWKDYPTSGINVQENGVIYFRLKSNKTGQTSVKYGKKITNIDTKAPNSFMATINEADITTSSITISGSTQDQGEAGGTAGSGIEKYYYSKDNGVTWEPTNGTTNTIYTFSGLTQNKSYHLKMKAVDKVEHQVITETITKSTASVPNAINKDKDTAKGNMTFIYSTTKATKENVTVKITTDYGEKYTIQYTTQDPSIENNWEDYTEGKEIMFEQNGFIYARLKDSTGQVGAYATGNITNIDKLPPKAFTTSTLTAISTENSITVTANTTDQKDANGYAGSGQIQYRFKLGTGSYTAYQTSGNYTFNSSTGYTLTKGTEYKITVEAIDAVGYKAEGMVTIRTKNTYTVTYNANGGTGAPANQTKVEGTNLTLSSTKPTRSEYVFKGWGTSASATTATYQANGIYSTDANLNLFAVWEYGGPKVDWFMATGPVFEYTHSGTKFLVNRYINGICTNFPARVTIRYSYKTATSWGGKMECKFDNVYQGEGEGVLESWTMKSGDVYETTKDITAGFHYLVTVYGDMMEGDWIKGEVVKVINLNTGLSVPF